MILKFDLDLIDRTLASASLSEFVRQAWPLLEPGTPLVWNWHLDVIVEHLEAVSAGEISRLAISVAPKRQVLAGVGFLASLELGAAPRNALGLRQLQRRLVCDPQPQPAHDPPVSMVSEQLAWHSDGG